MPEISDYIGNLSAALDAKKDWLEKSEMVTLKEELRVYQTSFLSLYSIFLKKMLVKEDPYKQEAKIGEIEVPDTSPFSEATSSDQLSIRLSNFDNQMDFLVNYYQFNLDFLNLERIKRILGLVRYIDWIHLSPDSQYANTRAIADITNQSKTGLDPIALSVINESLSKLSKSTNAVFGILRNLTAYYKESYKLNVRNLVTKDMSASEATVVNIRKKFSTALPGNPFYAEFIEELIKEDYSGPGPEIRDNILRSLAVVEEKPKVVKRVISYKNFLIDGLRVIGSVAATLGEIIVKIDENDNTLANQKKSFWERVKVVLRQMMHNEAEDHVFILQFMDPDKAVPVRQQLYYNQFRSDIERKMRTFLNMGAQGSLSSKFESMSEEQLVALLERSVRDTQNLHRILTAVDDYFKSAVPKELREKIKGIRPELATIKNAFVKANQMRYEYSAHKEEEEQMQRLGLNLSK
ncbi:MAG: hypothetical protein LBH43_21400 [Treponema sp.]|jgi:hypothetical protein|nr:hypothetical protein [Treponema sp.]